MKSTGDGPPRQLDADGLNGEALSFLTCRAVESRSLPQDSPYLLACRFVRCGLLDRTRTIEHPFEYVVFDKFQRLAPAKESFAEVCELRAAELTAEALEKNSPLNVMWSGGIDSTVALIALLKEAQKLGSGEHLNIGLSLKSIEEYPNFYRQFIHGKLSTSPIGFPVDDYLDYNELYVTGEHGDQLFGSDWLRPLVAAGGRF